MDIQLQNMMTSSKFTTDSPKPFELNKLNLEKKVLCEIHVSLGYPGLALVPMPRAT